MWLILFFFFLISTTTAHQNKNIENSNQLKEQHVQLFRCSFANYIIGNGESRLGSQRLNLVLSTRSFHPNVESVFIICHWWVQGWPLLCHKLLSWFNKQITLGVVKEGQGNTVFYGVHNHPVFYTLVYCIAQHLKDKERKKTCHWTFINL